MKKLVLLFLVGFNLAISQSIVLKPFETKISNGTEEHLKAFDVLQFDVQSLVNQIDAIPGNIKEINFRTPSRTWQLQLFEYSLVSPNWVRNTGDPKNVTRLPNRKDFRTFNGHIKGVNSIVSLSVGANGFFKLMIDDRKERFFIEPLDIESLSKNLPENQQFLFYKNSDVIPTKGTMCGADFVNKGLQDGYNQIKSRAAAPCKQCVIVKIALAADFTMYSKYGDKLKTEDQMLTIMADVQTVYDDEFANEYQYEVTGTYIAEDPRMDPFDGITDINTQLTTFSSQGLSMFTGSEFVVATCWSAKWRTGIIGLAYLDAVCNPIGYNVCSDYIGAGGRQGTYLTLQAHELGHNWSMIHDASISPTIMAPTISGSTQWSALSIRFLDSWVTYNKLIESGCLKICPGSAAPIPAFISDITYGCQPVTVHFFDQSSNAFDWKWSFPGGTPSTSTLQNPVVVYKTPGKYEVTLEAGNSRCVVSVTQGEYIEINDVPVADFSFGVNEGREVFFTNKSQRGFDYIWKFGDGEETDEIDPIHIYGKDTTYEVTLVVSNDCGVRTIKKKVKVVSKPIADFEADTIFGCAPKIIKFLDKSTNNVIKWVWDFPGGNPNYSFAQNPLIRYDNPGVYDVKLTVLSASSSHNLTKKLYITIDSLPDAEFDYQINGNTVSFKNHSRFSKSHYWIFGDNTFSSDTTPSHTYLEGRYEVLYIVQNDCGSDTAKTIITVGAKPIAGFQVNDHQGCLPFHVQFTNTSTVAATAFRWYFPGGNPSTSTDKNPLITYNSVGKFDVSLFAYNNFFSDSIGLSEFIEVKTEPTASFTNVVSGFKSFFTHQAVGATNYFWDFGDSHFSFEENPSYDYGVEGEFDVRLIVQNECGLDTFDKHIAIYLVPKVNFTADTIRGCAPLTVKFFDKSSIDVNEWDWQFENGNPTTSTSKNPIVIFPKKGKYSVKLSVKNTNGSNQLTRTQYIQVLSPVLCPENTKTNRFMISENPFGVNIEERSDRYDPEMPFVYPNPAEDYIYVYTGTESGETVSVDVFDLSGRKFANHTSTDSLIKIQTDQLKGGTYYVKIKNGTTSSICKFVVSE